MLTYKTHTRSISTYKHNFESILFPRIFFNLRPKTSIQLDTVVDVYMMVSPSTLLHLQQQPVIVESKPCETATTTTSPLRPLNEW